MNSLFSKSRVGLSILTIFSIVATIAMPFSNVALAAVSPAAAVIDTVNGQPSPWHCLAGPLTITGHGTTGSSGGPYSLDINWGDGTTTTLNTVASGSSVNFNFGPVSHTPVAGSTGITLTIYHGQPGGNDSFTPPATTQCIAPPTQGVLTVKKHVINDNGGLSTAANFTLHVKSGGTDVTGSSFAGSETGTDFQLNPGSYTTSEDTFAGYTQTSILGDCFDGGNTTVVAGQNYTCTITNDDNVPAPDTTAPVIASHANITAEATSGSGAVVTYTSPSATDNVDATAPATCLPASGSTFALGTTPVNCNKTDAAGNTATPTTFDVSVVDTTAPTVASVSNISNGATGPSGATVTFDTPTATDLVDGTDPVACLPASGSMFPIGPTTVICSATDAHDNTGTSQFQINIQDGAPSLIIPGNMPGIEATSPSGAVVTFSYSATDTEDGAVPATCTPDSGSTFALGTTTVNCSATDSAEHTTSGSFTVTVVDTTAPVITLIGSSIINLTIGDAYAEQGATAADVVDVTDPVTVGGDSVVTTSPATFQVTYDAVDTAGNHAEQVVRTVVVATAIHTLTYTAGANGSITGTSPQTVADGSDGSEVTAVADSGFHFVNWSDESTQNPRTDTNVTGNITVTASFAANPVVTHTLTYSAGANGTLSGTSPQTVNDGSDGSAITATGNSGFHFVNWSDEKTTNPRTDTNVTADISVTANFAANPPVVVSSGGGGGGTGGRGGFGGRGRVGDINSDGFVDILDLNILLANWGIPTNTHADLNNDGKVDIQDFNLIMVNWFPA